jgi:hypothetical protein
MPTFGILREPNETFIDEFRSYKKVAPLFPIKFGSPIQNNIK